MHVKIEHDDYAAIFSDCLERDWLPIYCHAPKRNYDVAGYRPESNKVTQSDAQNFMRALEANLVNHEGNGQYRMSRSRAFEVIFWEGSRKTVPRPITLWMEPVITIASVARLSLDYGWPVEFLGMQSAKGEFDLIAFLPSDHKNEFIAGEVKKTSKELKQLIDHLFILGSVGETDEGKISPLHKNAHRKLMGLLRCRAPLFWAIGPEDVGKLFEVDYTIAPRVSFNEVDIQRLTYPGTN